MRIVMHGHHAGTLFSYYPNEAAVEARRLFIATQKPEAERALRLALFADVTGVLPNDKARTAYDKARTALDKARTAYLASFDVDAFHREHCHPNCPWNGETIFARGTSVDVLEVPS